MQSLAANRRILVIDDNESVHEDFNKILGVPRVDATELDALDRSLFGDGRQPVAQNPFEIDSALQGAEGLAMVRSAVEEERPYAMAFVDVRMPPGWDGVETVSRIWEEYPDLQVVLCTAYSDHSWEKTVSVLDRPEQLVILRKPFDNIEVRQLATSMSEKWMKERRARSKREGLERQVAASTSQVVQVTKQLEFEASERERIEQELRRAQKLEAVGRLAAGVAHEINTPTQYIGAGLEFIKDSLADLAPLLRAYRGFVESARSGETTSEQLEKITALEQAVEIDYVLDEMPKAVEESMSGVDSVVHIVHGMKEFAHPGRVDKRAADLNQTIESALSIAKNEYKHVAEIVKDLGEIRTVQCNIADIGQVVLNLIVNAAHAIADKRQGTNERGVITVRSYERGNSVTIEIGDTGGGIPENIQPDVFEPFFTTKDVGRGTGQGLAIARSIVVDKHGGILRFETTPGEGTTFFVHLPMVPTV